MPVWKKAMGTALSTPGYIKAMIKKGAAFVAVDLREPDVAQKGYISGAVSIPASKLAASKGRFPKDMKAPIVLYTGEGIDLNAFKTVRGWGYKNSSVLKGGLMAWEKSSGRLMSGRMPSTIEYVKKTPKGEISVKDFKALLTKRLRDKLILDVRDSDAAQAGKLNSAVNIPLGELGGRLAELPKGKEIIIHCNTGIMASEAVERLKKKGYRARFLNAVVQVASNGAYEITEK